MNNPATIQIPMFSVVIPVYWGSLYLQELCYRLCSTLCRLGEDYEIILVNDASPDNSWEIIEQLTSADRRILGIDLSRNFGQHNAITAGLRASRGEWVVVMDCDLQDCPEEVEILYNALKSNRGADYAVAVRKERKDNFFKILTSRIFYAILGYLTETEQDPRIANFGVYHRKVIDAVLAMKDHVRFFPAMIQWVGFKGIKVPVNHASRQNGSSSYTMKKLFDLGFNVIISFSDKPLRLTVKGGLLISSLSFFYALFTLVRALLGEITVSGWPSLIISIWFLSGLIIAVMGMIGIYLGRTFEETKRRPVFIIRKTTNDDKYP